MVNGLHEYGVRRMSGSARCDSHLTLTLKNENGHVRRDLRSTPLSSSITRADLKPGGLPPIFVRPTSGSVGAIFCKRNLVFALRGACQ